MVHVKNIHIPVYNLGEIDGSLLCEKGCGDGGEQNGRSLGQELRKTEH